MHWLAGLCIVCLDCIGCIGRLDHIASYRIVSLYRWILLELDRIGWILLDNNGWMQGAVEEESKCLAEEAAGNGGKSDEGASAGYVV